MRYRHLLVAWEEALIQHQSAPTKMQSPEINGCWLSPKDGSYRLTWGVKRAGVFHIGNSASCLPITVEPGDVITVRWLQYGFGTVRDNLISVLGAYVGNVINNSPFRIEMKRSEDTTIQPEVPRYSNGTYSLTKDDALKFKAYWNEDKEGLVIERGQLHHVEILHSAPLYKPSVNRAAAKIIRSLTGPDSEFGKYYATMWAMFDMDAKVNNNLQKVKSDLPPPEFGVVPACAELSNSTFGGFNTLGCEVMLEMLRNPDRYPDLFLTINRGGNNVVRPHALCDKMVDAFLMVESIQLPPGHTHTKAHVNKMINNIEVILAAKG